MVIWIWKGFAQRETERKPVVTNVGGSAVSIAPESKKPDLLLPYGYLFEAPELNYEKCCKFIKTVALLPNYDIVVGPELRADQSSSRDQHNREMTEFKNDMIYLKLAMDHGTIEL